MGVSVTQQDVHAQFAAAGLLVDGPLEIGRLTRCKVEGDKGAKRSGWYVLHELRLDSGDMVLVGRYGNWKNGTGDEGLAVEFDAGGLTEAERYRMKREADAARQAAERDRKERAANAAKRAGSIFEKLPESGLSDYLKRKKVRAHGLRFSRGSIVVPVRNAQGALVGLQFIAPDGDKKLLTGTAKRGAFHLIGNVDPDTGVLAVAEGYATAATVHECTGWPVAVAFDAGNLVPVAQAVRKLHPDPDIVICADDDRDTPGNPGVSQAHAAAQAVAGKVLIPQWPEASA